MATTGLRVETVLTSAVKKIVVETTHISHFENWEDDRRRIIENRAK
jgi:hypothetical protein